MIFPMIFTVINPSINPLTVETNRPDMVLSISSDDTELKSCDKATDAPASEAISAWLSLVGIPNNHAVTAHTIIVIIEEHKVRHANSGLFPKSAIPVIVSTTLPLNNDIRVTPRKFIAEARNIAFWGLIDFVEIQVAIAVGASVQPLTVITPDKSNIAITVIGSLVNSTKKSDRSNKHQSPSISVCTLPEASSKGSLSVPLKPVSSLQMLSFSSRMSLRIELSLSEKV